MKKILSVLSVIILVMNLPAYAQIKRVRMPYSDGSNINMATLNNDILVLVNKYRRSIGKPDLQLIDVMNTQATIHSKDMVNGSTGFGHEGFEARVENIKKSVGFLSAAAENVAEGTMTAAQVVDGWLHSPGHKKNIEGDYNYTGIGTAQRKDGTVYFTQIFIIKK